MEEINTKDLFLYAKSKIVIPIIIIILFIIGGSIYSLCFKKPIYVSTASIILSSNGTTKVSQEDISISKSLSQTFKEIGTSRQVLSKTIEELNLKTTYDNLKNSIKITTSTDTVITEISVSTEEAKLSKNIANSIAKNLIEQIKATYTIDNLQIFDEATESQNPTNIDIIKDEIIYFLSGITAGFLLVLIKFYFSDTELEMQKIKNKRVKISLE